MKVNFRQSFKDFKGNEITSKGKPLMINEELGKALFGMAMSGNVPLSGDEKYMAYKLCNRLVDSGETDITAEETVFLLKVCAQKFSAGAYGQIRDLIENNN